MSALLWSRLQCTQVAKSIREVLQGLSELWSKVLKGGLSRVISGSMIGVIKGSTRSLD